MPNTIPGSSVIPGHAINIIIPPWMVDPPDAAASDSNIRNWISQSMQAVGATDKNGAPFTMPNPGTKSDAMILLQAPTIMQETAIYAAISGVLDTPIARNIREQFENGASLSLHPYHLPETYRTFVPLLTKIGQPDEFLLGLPPTTHEVFHAQTLAEALQTGRSWYKETREKEVTAAIDEARQTKREIDFIQVAVLAGRLRCDGVLRAQNQRTQQWEVVVEDTNIHDRYKVYGPDYVYGFTADATVAATLGAIAARRRGLAIASPQNSDVFAIAPPDWQMHNNGSGEHLATWRDKGYLVRETGQVLQRGNPVGSLSWKHEKFTITDARGRRICPPIPLSRPPTELRYAWAVGVLLEKAKVRFRKS